MKRLFLSLCIMSCMCFVAQAQGVTAESLVGEWRWVGKNVPELILVLEVGNKAPDSHGLKISSLYRYRIEDYQDPDCLFDGKTIHIRKDVGENAYIELDLRPQGEDLVGRCMMVGLLEKDFDDEICLRRNYFEYDTPVASCSLEDIAKGWKTKPIDHVLNGSLGILLERFNQTWPTWMVGAVCKTMEKGLSKEILEEETGLTVIADVKNGYVEVNDAGTDGEYMSACVWNRNNGHRLLAVRLGDPTDPFIEFVCFYDYDPQKKMLTPEPQILAGFKEWTYECPLYYGLPMVGKNMLIEEFGPDGHLCHTFAWDGMKPVYSKTERIESYDAVTAGSIVPFRGKQPTIIDFVDDHLRGEDIGEALGELRDMWKLYRLGKTLPKGKSFIVDVKNGYVRYDSKYSDQDWQYMEFCVWNYADKRHKLVAYCNDCFHEGKPIAGQYTGLEFSIYDNDTHRMKPAYAPDLGAEVDVPDDHTVTTHSLPRTGKTLVYTFYTPSGEVRKSLTWNGSKFIPQ